MSPSAPMRRETAAADPLVTLRKTLDDLATVVVTLDAATYTARPLAGVSGSIGEHVRHALDHIAALVSHTGTEPLCYDHRERGTAVESDATAALRRILRLKATFDGLSHRRLDTPICVRTQLSADGDECESWSSFGRELAFVMNHTVHHQALIAALLAVEGVEIPDDRFGYAPSTPRD